MNQSIEALRQTLGSSFLPIVCMIFAAVAMGICRHMATVRMKNGYSTNWHKGGFNFFAVMLAISGVLMVYDRVTATNDMREAEATAQAQAEEQQRENDYQRQLMSVKVGIMRQSSHDLTPQANGFQNNPPSTSSNFSGGQTNR